MHRIAVVVLALVALPLAASAGVEVGGTAGLHVFSVNNGLGVEATHGATSEKNSALFGVRLGVYFGSTVGIEAEVGVIPSEARSQIFDIYNLAYRGALVLQFRSANPDNSVIPFVLGGAGVLQVVQTQNPEIIAKDSELTPFVGAGLKYRAANGFGLRFDLRALLPKSSEPGKSISVDYEMLLSLYKEWGRPKKQEKVVPPPKDDDPDHDGITTTDKCPNEPEDKDGFQDEDGCPDPDNDGDGIADATDKCPLEAEDKDNFQDDDGCPDPDNDGDGVPDAADKCPLEPETKNGFQDDDGCPDEIPDKLKAFTGVIQGITFKVNASELAGGSTKQLDKAVAVLGEFKDIKLEIQGHTDDQPLGKGGKYASNAELSQARAESVKAYFVTKGIDEARLTAKGYGDSAPVEDPKGLKAGKLASARAKNRRVEFKLISSLDGAATPPAPEPVPAPAP